MDLLYLILIGFARFYFINKFRDTFGFESFAFNFCDGLMCAYFTEIEAFFDDDGVVWECFTKLVLKLIDFGKFLAYFYLHSLL